MDKVSCNSKVNDNWWYWIVTARSHNCRCAAILIHRCNLVRAFFVLQFFPNFDWAIRFLTAPKADLLYALVFGIVVPHKSFGTVQAVDCWLFVTTFILVSTMFTSPEAITTITTKLFTTKRFGAFLVGAPTDVFAILEPAAGTALHNGTAITRVDLRLQESKVLLDVLLYPTRLFLEF